MKCDYCPRIARVNYQKVWSRWNIRDGHNYSKDNKFDPLLIEEPIERDNIHLCKQHEKEWLEFGDLLGEYR